MREIRLDPRRNEWIVISSQRANRPMTVVEKKSCPFCVDSPEAKGKQAPYWLPNAFPMLSPDEVGKAELDGAYKRMPGRGYCEVIVESFDHTSDLCDLSPDELEKAMKLYRDRYVDLSRKEGVKAVLIFRNMGKLIGVSIEHPHSQVYAIPYVPPIIRQEAEASKTSCPFCEEADAKDRLIFEYENVRTIFPFAPRWPYETIIIPVRHITSLAEANDAELREIGISVGRIVGCYHRLFGVKMPYVLAFHQSQTLTSEDRVHLHVELYPALRAPDRLKHWSGAEIGFGVYTYDFSPEDKAKELASVCQKNPTLPISSRGIPDPNAI
ncbi:MAG: galactose-1-phosphate uridylyltransferase [Thermoprotei archaeon]